MKHATRKAVKAMHPDIHLRTPRPLYEADGWSGVGDALTLYAASGIVVIEGDDLLKLYSFIESILVRKSIICERAMWITPQQKKRMEAEAKMAYQHRRTATGSRTHAARRPMSHGF